MWQCHYCRLSLSLEVWQKNRQCPHCGSDLHSCKNCVHYDEASSVKCKEPHSEWISNRETQNDCTFFEHRPATTAAAEASSSENTSEAEQAKEAFRALFRDL